jgi:hypothetical protein
MVSIRTWKITTLSLAIVVAWLAWGYWSLAGQVIRGAFVSQQAVMLRHDIKDTNEGAAVSQNAGAMSSGERILYDLNW